MRDISKAENPEMRDSLAALQRAARMARETAIRTNTHLVVVIDGKLTRIPPDVLRAEAARNEKDA